MRKFTKNSECVSAKYGWTCSLMLLPLAVLLTQAVHNLEPGHSKKEQKWMRKFTKEMVSVWEQYVAEHVCWCCTLGCAAYSGCAGIGAWAHENKAKEWMSVKCRVGQNHIYTVYIRYFWQGNHQIYGHIRCIYTVLANPSTNPCWIWLKLAEPQKWATFIQYLFNYVCVYVCVCGWKVQACGH